MIINIGAIAPLRKFDYKRNALNSLKTLAAIQVAYVHIITHLKIDIPSIVNRVFSVFMGVPIFFILSGFLIWNSVGKCANFKNYATKRLIRIFPELWIGIAAEIITLLILFKGDFDWLLFAVFIFGQATIFQFYTPAFLRSYGCGTPNGTLWTIGITIQFYVVVWFIYKLFNNKNKYWWIVAIIISIAIKAVSPAISMALPGVVGKLYGQTLLPYLWMFIFGCFLAHFQERIIPFLKRTWWVFLVLSFVFSITKFDIGTQQYGVFTYLFRVAGLIGLCYNIPNLNIHYDISYGLFIYHMIVVNVMIELGFVAEIYYLVIALLISIILATASNMLGRALKNKLTKKLWRNNYEFQNK